MGAVQNCPGEARDTMPDAQTSLLARARGMRRGRRDRKRLHQTAVRARTHRHACARTMFVTAVVPSLKGRPLEYPSNAAFDKLVPQSLNTRLHMLRRCENEKEYRYSDGVLGGLKRRREAQVGCPTPGLARRSWIGRAVVGPCPRRGQADVVSVVSHPLHHVGQTSSPGRLILWRTQSGVQRLRSKPT